MATATLTSKGQITLPIQVRTRLNLQPGDQLRFEVGPDGTLIGRPATRSATSLIGILKLKGRKSVSVDAIDKSIARELSRKRGVKK
ncbi:MAG: AbrB/MazE/SpoVT family DNA-binding domain-containing protein [Steroidobacter sp.]